MATQIKKDKWDSLYWHDGHIDDISFSIEETGSNIELRLRLYDDFDAPKRNIFNFLFKNVVSWQSSCDTSKLFEYRYSGEIIDGYFKTCKQERKKDILTFRMYICDGFLEINSKDVEIIELGPDNE